MITSGNFYIEFYKHQNYAELLINFGGQTSILKIKSNSKQWKDCSLFSSLRDTKFSIEKWRYVIWTWVLWKFFNYKSNSYNGYILVNIFYKYLSKHIKRIIHALLQHKPQKTEILFYIKLSSIKVKNTTTKWIFKVSERKSP